METKTQKRSTKTAASAKPAARTSRTPKKEAREAVGSLEAHVYAMSGKEVATLKLPEAIFGAAWRPALVHQVTTALAANLRQNRAHTKIRSEVAGGGKKPWKQKGTGRARHGSSRSPIWRHGGITFGPRNERDYSEKVNRTMKRQALFSLLSRKMKDGEIVFVDSLSFGVPKTKEAIQALSAIGKASGTKLISGKKEGKTALIALSSHDLPAVKSFRNMKSIATEEARNLNPLAILSYRYLIIEKPEEVFAILSKQPNA